MMTLEQLLAVIQTEATLASMSGVGAIDGSADECLDLFIADAAPRDRHLKRFVLYRLKAGCAIELVGSELWEDRLGLSVFTDELGFAMARSDRALRLTFPDTREKRLTCVVGSSIPDAQALLVETLRTAFEGSDERQLREEAQAFLSAGGVLRVRVVPRFGARVRKAGLERTRDAFVRRIRHGRGASFVECTGMEDGFTIRLRRDLIRLDLRAHADYGIEPGAFVLGSEHLEGIVAPTASQWALLSDAIDFRNPTEWQAILMAHIDLGNDFFRYLPEYLSKAGDSPIAQTLREAFAERLAAQRQRAKELVLSLTAVEWDLDEAMAFVPADEQAQIFEDMRGKDPATVQRLLGELVELGVLYRLAQDSALRLVSGEPGEQEHIKRLGFRITYQRTGSMIHIHDFGRNKNCNIGNLALLGGLPIIIQSVTGKDDTPARSVELKKAMVSRIYGAMPIFVELKVGDEPVAFKEREDRYRVTLPVKKALRALALTEDVRCVGLAA